MKTQRKRMFISVVDKKDPLNKEKIKLLERKLASVI